MKEDATTRRLARAAVLLAECRRVLNQEAENYRDDDTPRGKAQYQPHAQALHKLADRIKRFLP